MMTKVKLDLLEMMPESKRVEDRIDKVLSPIFDRLDSQWKEDMGDDL